MFTTVALRYTPSFALRDGATLCDKTKNGMDYDSAGCRISGEHQSRLAGYPVAEYLTHCYEHVAIGLCLISFLINLFGKVSDFFCLKRPVYGLILFFYPVSVGIVKLSRIPYSYWISEKKRISVPIFSVPLFLSFKIMIAGIPGEME